MTTTTTIYVIVCRITCRDLKLLTRDAESLFFVWLRLWLRAQNQTPVLQDLLCDIMIVYLRMTREKF